ncbi:MAG: N-acetylmuramoyl-L-alanine amidase [Clostridium sp.]
MKIAIRAGHNFSVPGAFGFIDETCENRRVKDEVIKYLEALDYEILDVTSSDYYNTVESDLAYGVNSANEWNAELFISIHFNNEVKFYNGEIGCEVWVYNVFKEAENVVNSLGNLGFKNRGLKIRQNLYELKHTKMKAMIINICFVEAILDVDLYNSLGANVIGKTIAEGIYGEEEFTKNKCKEEKNQWVEMIQNKINLEVTGILNNETLSACPKLEYKEEGDFVKIVQEILSFKGFNIKKIDGILGEETKKAIIKFQTIHELKPDGVVGYNTWKYLLK